MEDHAYNKALKRRAELLEEVEKIDVFLELWHHYSGGTKAETASPKAAAPVSAPARSARPKKAGSLSREEVVVEIRRVLLETGRPMTRGALLKELLAQGVAVGGTNKSKNLGTILWRSRDEIVHIDGAGYWVKDKQCPAIGYLPEGQGLFD
jgi:hypothetical protein